MATGTETLHGSKTDILEGTTKTTWREISHKPEILKQGQKVILVDKKSGRNTIGTVAYVGPYSSTEFGYGEKYFVKGEVFGVMLKINKTWLSNFNPFGKEFIDLFDENGDDYDIYLSPEKKSNELEA